MHRDAGTEQSTAFYAAGRATAPNKGGFGGGFPNAEVLGTEISETATQFEMTIHSDFHDIKDG